MRRVVCVLAIGLAVAAAVGADDDARSRRRTPVVEVFEQCRDAVVNISTTRVVRSRSLLPNLWRDDIFDFGPCRSGQREVHSVGSGVVIHESGFIVTNAHVVSQASDVSVTFADGSAAEAHIIAVDPEHDLAVLKIAAPKPLATCRMAAAGDILIGETVVAIGNPLGLQHTVTTGIVSALDRELTFGDGRAYRGLIQTDTAINPGNSGGPLLNVNAELIGINTAIRGDAQNIGFSIPVARLWELLPQMLDIERRQRVNFGVHVRGAEALVTQVAVDSPAARAGVVAGDRIVRFDDAPIRDGIDYYVHLLAHNPGDAIRLGLQRGQRAVAVKLTLEALPPPDGAKLAEERFGVELREITPEARRRSQLPDYARLVVVRVDRGGPADRVGMQPGDLIVRLDRLPVETLTDVGLVLERTEAGASVVVDGVRPDPLFSWSVAMPTR